MNVFLDLEGTVIEQWQQFPTFLPGRCRFIRHWMKNHPVTSVSVFSFAIHTDEEQEQFWMTMAEDVERHLDCKVGLVITVPMMQVASEAINKVRFFDVTDFIQMRGKDMAFHDWCHKHCQNQESVLFDDVVPNRVTVDGDDGSIISTINILKPLV